MRIRFLARSFPPSIGGVARSAGRIANALAQLGHQVEVLVWGRELPAGQESIEQAGPGLRVRRLGAFSNSDSTLQQVLACLESAQRASPCDCYWGHYLDPCGFLAAYAARRWGGRSIVAARGNDVDRAMLPPGDFARLRWTVESADQVVAVSGDLADSISALFPDCQASVLPNAVDGALFAPGSKADLHSRYGLPRDEPVIGFSGELRFKKGGHILLEAFARLVERRPARLLVIGDMRAREREQLERLHLANPEAAERICVTGHIDDQAAVAELLCACDVIALPSLWDGMPNALLEAMACERVVVAAASGGIPEVMADGQGVLLTREELGRLDEALEEVIAAGPAARAEIGAAARARVMADFTPLQEAERLAALLSSVMSSA